MTTRVAHYPFTSRQACVLVPAEERASGARPPLLVVVHGYAQTGDRQHRWMGRAVPPAFAAAFPDGFHPFEVRKQGRPPRIGYAWYVFSGDRPAFLASLARASEALWELVDRLADDLDADASRVFLAGFSQGAYLVNHAAMTRPDRCAGWIAQCGNFREDYLQGAVPDLAGTPVLLQYGEHDTALPEGAAESCRELITGFGADVTTSVHDAPHAITPGMADEARDWLAAHAGG